MDYKNELEELITAVIRENGSDVHITTGHYPSIRVAGELIFLVKRQAFVKEDVLGILNELLQDEKKLNHFLESQELDFSYTFQNDARLRGNAFVAQGGCRIGLSLISNAKRMP